MESEEIDLFDLYNAFKKTPIYRFFNETAHFILKQKIAFSFFIILGAVGGYFLEDRIPPIFRTEMIVQSKLLDNYTCNQIISALDTLLDDGNTDELEQLGFSKTVLSSLKRVEFIYPEQGSDSLKMKEPFRIALYTSSNKSFKEAEITLLRYLINTPFSFQNQEEKKETLMAEQTILLYSISSIDSMQNAVLNHLALGKINASKTSFDPSSLIQEKKATLLRLTKIEKELINVANFSVLKSFTPRNTPIQINKYYILKFSLLSFILGFILLRLFKK